MYEKCFPFPRSNDICIIKYVLGSKWTPANNCNATTYQKQKVFFFNYKLNVKTGFLDPEDMGRDTKADFLSHILRKLWGTEYLAHLAQTGHFIFCLYDRKVAQGCWSGTFLILIHMICQVNANTLFHFGKCK